MFGSNQFTFETPNVIDMGDVQPPTPPSRSSTSLRSATTRPTSTSPAEGTISTTSTSVSSTPNSVASSRKNSNDTDDMIMDHRHDNHLANSTNEHDDDIALARVNATRLLNDIRDLELQHQHHPYPTAVSSPTVPEQQHPTTKPLSQRLPFRDFPTYVVQSDDGNNNSDHHHHHSLPNSSHDAYIHAASTSNKKSIGRTMKLSAPRIVGTTSKKSLFSRSKGVIDDENDDKQSLYETDKDTIFSSNINKLRAWMEEIWFYMKLYRRTISIIVIIVLIVALSTTVKRTKTHVSYGDDGKGGTMPNFAGTDRYDQIVTYISETKHITTKETLLAHDGKTSKTPQNAALNWIAGIDEMQYPIDHPQFLQRYILAVMYFATGGTISSTRRLYHRTLQGSDEDGSKAGAGWVQPLHFLSNTNECTWSNVIAVPSYTNEMLNMGVSCNNNNDVTSIFIPNNGLHGSIPSEVGYLSHLTLFGVQNNDHIIGTIPTTFASLTNLLYVNFNQNQLSGSIPDFVGNWNDCEVLGFESNNMTGTIPASLGTMSRLLTIALSNNNFTGSLELIRHLPSIEYFYVANNQFTGEIEEEFFYNMQHIRELDLSHNEFHGNFPFRMLFKGENLHTIDIAHNHFMGTFPHVISTPNYVLHYLNIRNNRISGSIPNSINMITQLQHFDITNNVMTGTLPNSIGKCTELEYLFLGNNSLTMVDSSDGTRLLPPLSELDLLRELSLTGLGIPGPIPTWLRLLTDLEMLDLSHNELTGTIPHKLWSLPKLYYLVLNDNMNITGPLPTSGREQLSLLSVHHTSIDDGNFDNAVCKDTNINVLNGGSGIVVIADCNSGCTDSCCNECCTPDVDSTNDSNDPCSNNSELIAKFTNGIDHVVTSFAFDPSVLAEADVFDEVDEMIENP